MGDLRIFLKYVFNLEGFSKGIKDEIKKIFHPRMLFIILLGISIYSLWKLRDERLAGIFLFFAVLAHLRLVYVSGEHRRWYRQKMGIKTKNELIRIEHENGIKKEEEEDEPNM